MTKVGFLHTSPAHLSTFSALVAATPADARIESIAVVHEELLEAARRRGPHDSDVLRGLGLALLEMRREGAGLIVCTCSTLGGATEELGLELGLRVMRVDRPMAEAAIGIGGRIAVVAALASTVGPTRALLEAVATERSVTPTIEIHLVEGAWDLFESGDVEGYVASIAAILPDLADDADVIVLAQASMAPAADLVAVGCPVLASPSSFARWLETDQEVAVFARGQAPPSSESDPS